MFSISCNCWLTFAKLRDARSRLYRSRFLQENTRLNSYLKALDEIYKIYTLLHLLTPIWKPWKALLASVIRAKNTAPEKKPTDHSNAVRSTGSREKKVHTALCSANEGAHGTLLCTLKRRCPRHSALKRRCTRHSALHSALPSPWKETRAKWLAMNSFFGWQWIPSLKNDQDSQHSAGNEFLL